MKIAKIVLVGLIALACIISFTVLGFFDEQHCNGIEVNSLWCAIHPMKWNDIVGIVLAYAGFVWFTGIGSLFNIDLYSPVGSTSGNGFAFAFLCVAALLIIL